MAAQMVIEAGGNKDSVAPDSRALVPETESAALIRIIDRVIERPDFDVAKLSALLDVRERYEKNEARKAFAVALAAFKSNPPILIKNKHVRYQSTKGQVDYDHATLDHIADTLGKSLSAQGLSFRWQTAQENNRIRVTCFLQHRDGHGESVTLEASPDESGGKNAIQAVGSTVSYLQRYTLLAATGMATGGQDDDGRAAGPSKSMEDLQERLEWIANSRDTGELHRLYTAAYKAAEELNDARSMSAIIEAKNRKYKDLSNLKRGA